MFREVKFLHCSDIHLDMPFTSLGSVSGLSSKRRMELKDTFGRIVELASERAVDLLLITGDLFEAEYVKRSTISFINDLFSKISNIKICLIPGNHDPYTRKSYYYEYPWSDNVYILAEDRPFVSFAEIGTVVCSLSGISSIKKADKGYINLLLLHGTIDLDIGSNTFNPLKSADIGSFGMDYTAVGHFHNSLKNIGGKRIYNPGSPEPLGFDEPGEHGVFFGHIKKYETGESSLEVSFIQTCKRSVHSVEVNIDRAYSDRQVVERILERLAHHGFEVHKDFFEITLCGYTVPGYSPDIRMISEGLEGKLFFAKIKDSSLMEYNISELACEAGLKGIYARKLTEKISKAMNEEEKRCMVKALYFGLEALDHGNIISLDAKEQV